MSIKINGTAVPVNPQVMSAEDCRRVCYEILKPAQIERFEKELELNFSYPIEGGGNFRVNLMMQRGSVAAGVRYICSNVPPFESLGPPNVRRQAALEKRCPLRVVGATGSGKST